MDYLPFVTCKIDSKTFNMEVKIYSYGEQIGNASVLAKNGKVVYLDFSIPPTSRLTTNKYRVEIPQNEIVKACEDFLHTIG